MCRVLLRRRLGGGGVRRVSAREVLEVVSVRRVGEAGQQSPSRAMERGGVGVGGDLRRRGRRTVGQVQRTMGATPARASMALGRDERDLAPRPPPHRGGGVLRRRPLHGDAPRVRDRRGIPQLCAELERIRRELQLGILIRVRTVRRLRGLDRLALRLAGRGALRGSRAGRQHSDVDGQALAGRGRRRLRPSALGGVERRGLGRTRRRGAGSQRWHGLLTAPRGLARRAAVSWAGLAHGQCGEHDGPVADSGDDLLQAVHVRGPSFRPAHRELREALEPGASRFRWRPLLLDLVDRRMPIVGMPCGVRVDRKLLQHHAGLAVRPHLPVVANDGWRSCVDGDPLGALGRSEALGDHTDVRDIAGGGLRKVGHTATAHRRPEVHDGGERVAAGLGRRRREALGYRRDRVLRRHRVPAAARRNLRGIRRRLEPLRLGGRRRPHRHLLVVAGGPRDPGGLDWRGPRHPEHRALCAVLAELRSQLRHERRAVAVEARSRLVACADLRAALPGDVAALAGLPGRAQQACRLHVAHRELR
mmetsp:Transcript_131085/g.379239  ORF Transcript_131085/g.379239 Transcript_131085/m.379239 type:complete len:533 (+) Transcript_131085:1325-2923(+)